MAYAPREQLVNKPSGTLELSAPASYADVGP
jgi:hypothetical protein